MKTQDFMLNFMAQASRPAVKESFPKRHSDKSQPAFKEVLSSNIDRTTSKVKLNNTDSADTVQSRDSGYRKNPTGMEKPEREANNCLKAQKAERSKGTGKIDQSKDTDTEKTQGSEEKETKKEIALKTLAELMGIEPSNMLKLLESLNIEAEELLDQSRIDKLIEKLGSFLELDLQQKDALKGLMKEINEQIKEILESGNGKVEQEMKTKDWIQVKNTVVKIVDKIKLNDSHSLINRLELEHIRQKLQHKMEGFDNKKNEITESPDMIKAKGEVTADKSSLSTEAEKGDNNDKTTGANKDDSSEAKSSKELWDKQPSNMEGNDDSDANTELKASVEQNQQFNSMINGKASKQEKVVEAVKLEREVHMPKQEIINQVIDNAKVVLSGEKSEMVINLKPDHLGKLSLKIVTENGIVAAKIVAENQQVKQILESNMQLLKDSLEKQGMMVQGFSVSVRQDSPKSSFGNENRDGMGKQRPGRTNYTGGITGTEEIVDNHNRINPYDWMESSINLTA